MLVTLIRLNILKTQGSEAVVLGLDLFFCMGEKALLDFKFPKGKVLAEAGQEGYHIYPCTLRYVVLPQIPASHHAIPHIIGISPRDPTLVFRPLFHSSKYRASDFWALTSNF